MILELLVTVLTALTPVIAMLTKDYVATRQANAPERHQGEVDHELASPDKRAFSARLSGLFDRTRPPTHPE